MQQLAFRILATPQIVIPYYLCAYLGEGTAESAVELMSRCDIEVTTTVDYRKWLQTSWGVTSSSQANKSSPVINAGDLDAGQRNYVTNFCREDLMLYDRIARRIERRGDGRVFGPELR